MTRWKDIGRDQRGVAAIELAFALPVVLLFVFGIFQLGVILQANAGMQHALGQGARYATLFPKPADSDIVARMSSSKALATNVGTFNTPTVTTPATAVCVKCRILTVSYSVTPNFVFFNGPVINLSQSKRVYTVS